MIEKSFNSLQTIADLKRLLEPMIGISSSQMQIKSNGNLIGDNQSIAPFSEFDVSGNEIQFEWVEKMEMDDQQYDALPDSVRAFKKRNNLGRFGKTFEKCLYDVGSRCLVKENRGTVQWVGELPGKSGDFVGVQLDEPLGKNDGSYDGKRFFSCPNNYGIFVRPNQCQIGDYPEIDILEEF